MNRITLFKEYGSADVLKIETEDKPELISDDEVLVKMSAYALNRANVLFREGNYIYDAEFPSRIGAEAMGVIEQIGKNVSYFKIGDRVNLLPPENESKSGYFSDFNIVHKKSLLPVAESLSDLEAATCWVPYLTLYKIFVEDNYSKAGNWIILPAASSSVSLAANQLAKHMGAKTIGITRTSKKVKKLLQFGYDAVVVSQEENIEERIKEITGGGADFAFDPVGGKDLVKIINSLKNGSELCVYGILSGSTTELPIFPLMFSNVKIFCYSVYELFTDPERLKKAVSYFLPLFEQRKLLPIYDELVLDLDKIVDAFKYLESNEQFGKVVIRNTM